MFNDRFINLYSLLGTQDINTIAEGTVQSTYPALYEMVLMVRRHSVLLKKKTVGEIYYAITEHADPRIALILAAARDPEGGQMFPNISSVREFMFGGAPSIIETTYVDFEDRTLFVDGVKRVSAALAASVLIAQLAQIPEQANHADALEKQALADLDRVLLIPRIDPIKATVETIDEYKAPFYFEAQNFFINENSTFLVKVYLSSNLTSLGWINVNTYADEVNTASIVADIADTINSLAFSNLAFGGLLASPVIKDVLHYIEVSARDRDFSVKFNIISIDFVYLDEVTGERLELPFKWGVQKKEIDYGYIKSALVKVEKNTKEATLSTFSLNDLSFKNSLNVLYFRRAQTNEAGDLINGDNEVITDYSNTLKYRISPTMSKEDILTLPDIDNPILRPSALAELLLNSLYTHHTDQDDLLALGAIIRNDPSDSNARTSVGQVIGDQLVAIELVAYTTSYKEQWLILDVLQIPEDIEMAVGNLFTPITRFSNRPRSIRVQAFYESPANKAITNGEGQISLIKAPKSKLQQSIQDIRNNYEINSYYDSVERYLVQPPNLIKTYEY